VHDLRMLHLVTDRDAHQVASGTEGWHEGVTEKD